MRMIRPESLGSAAFRSDYGIKYAYLAGSMYKGIASKDMVVSMGRAGLMGYFGTGGLTLPNIECAIRKIQVELDATQPYGMNLLPSMGHPGLEERTVDLFLAHEIRNVEAAAYTRLTPALVRYRLKGLSKKSDGTIAARNRILAK